MPSTASAGIPSLGCCEVFDLSCFDNVPYDQCAEIFGSENINFVSGGSCVGGLMGTCEPAEMATATPTSTPTTTPTATPTETPALDGALCAEDIQCASTFCADGVCCNTACTEPDEGCNETGSVGVCVRLAAPVPAASDRGLVAMALTLIGLGALAMRRRTAD